MCGICGFISKKRITLEQLKHMNDTMYHRGPNDSGEEIFQALREHDIYVRHWNKPRIADSLRISIGTDEEMHQMIAFLEDYLERRGN